VSYTLVYDAKCGPCTRFRNLLGLLGRRSSIKYEDLALADRKGRLAAVNRGERYRSFHLISPGGEVWSGPDSFPRLTALLPGGFILSRALSGCPPVSSSAAHLYAALSKVHDSGTCGNPSAGIPR
jgi:predicted DCC family thiol-disulfide oxidoreductase YuxK